jgi:ABC-type uncharacterized transport system fused permease/ATPase subunit
MTKPNEAGMRDLIHQFREFLLALRLSPGRRGLALLVAATVFAIGATAAAQVSLNAWNGPFYEAIAQRNFSAFLYELLVFAAIASGLLVLNVAQAWLRELIKLNSREWLTRDLHSPDLRSRASPDGSLPSSGVGVSRAGVLRIEKRPALQSGAAQDVSDSGLVGGRRCGDA